MSDDLLERLSRLSFDDSHADLVDQVVKGLTDGQISLPDVMQSLSHLATSRSSNDRYTCLSVINQVIHQVPDPCISSKEADVLLLFICQRMAIENAMVPILTDMMHTICRRQPTISDTSTVMIFKSLSQEISLGQQRADDRFLAYQIVRELADKNLSSLTHDPFDFVVHFLEMVDGERDPRCLILKFSLFAHIIPKLDLGHLAEDAFESVAVYFPVSYHAPANDPYAISRDDLAKALVPCLKASHQFAPFFYQLMGEKMTSERRDAKIDCYQAMTECASFFGSDQLRPYMSIFWTCIRSDCMKVNSSDDDVQDAACDALTVMIRVMNDDEDHLKHLLSEIEQDLRPALVKHDLDLRDSAIKLLVAASRSAKSFPFFENHSIQHLLTSLAFDASRINGLEIHNLLIKFYSNDVKEYATSDKLTNNSHILSLCLTEEKDEPELIRRKLQLFYNVIDCGLQFNKAERKEMGAFVMSFVTNSSMSLHSLHSAIFAIMMQQERISVNEDVVKMMEATWASADPDRLSVLFKDVTLSAELSRTLLTATVARIVKEEESDDVDKLFALLSLISGKFASDQELLLQTAESMITAQQDNNNMQRIACELVKNLDSVHASKFMHKLRKSKEHIELNEFMIFLSSIRVPVSLIEYEDDDLIGRWCLSEDRKQVDQMICCVAAKCKEDRIRDMLMQFVKEKNELSTAAQLTKGLAWIGKNFNDSLDILLQFFQTERSGEAADAILMLHQAESCLNSFPKSSFVYQRIFFSSLPRLTSLLQGSISDEEKSDVQKAILCQLRFLPPTVIRTDLKKIHSLLISSLSANICSTTDAQSTGLECLKHLLQDSSASSLIRNNLNSILNSLLHLSTTGQLIDRKNALTCLSLIIRLMPESSLLPQRKHVLKIMSNCLSDKKRIVRYAAADAVSKWMMLGQPGNTGDE